MNRFEYPLLEDYLYDPQIYKVDIKKRVCIDAVVVRAIHTLEKMGFTFKYDYNFFTYNQKYFSLVINRDLIINDSFMTELPFKIYKVKGNVDIIGGNLTSLVRTPTYVEGYFNVSGNKLKNLSYFPKNVGGGIYINNNQLTKLRNLPTVVNGDFDCSGNNLKSIKNGPSKVNGIYNCSSNNLKNLDGAPDSQVRFFDCSKNPIEDFRSIPCNSNVFSLPHAIPEYIIKNKNIIIAKNNREVIVPNYEYEEYSEKDYKLSLSGIDIDETL